MSGFFPKKDRQVFQILIDHHLDALEDLATLFNSSELKVRKSIARFCDAYKCGVRGQILNYEVMGLHPFFLQTKKPFNHPYALRRFRMAGDETNYLTLCVTPNIAQLPSKFKNVYYVTKIYSPTNNIRLLYEEERRITYYEEWLLTLKEIMVEEEMGSVMLSQEPIISQEITVDGRLLSQLMKIFLHERVGRMHYKYVDIVKSCKGLISTYLDLRLPDMEDYIIILNKVANPLLFVGGFIGRFPVTELYQCQDALICKIKIPELNFAKLNLMLFTHLIKVCIPGLWLLAEDKRFFNLDKQLNDGRWDEFEIPLDFKG